MKKTVATVLAILLGVGSFGLLPNKKGAEVANAAVSDDKAVAQTVAEEGAVLLKNDGALPLLATDEIAAYRMDGQVYGGKGSGEVATQLKKSYKTALNEARDAKKIKTVYFDRLRGNKALYLISRSATEGGDNSATAGGFYLNQTEKDEITELIGDMGAENVVVILNVGSVIDTSWLLEQNVGSILLVYYGGSMSGDALVNVLTGEVNPSGKTVDTWAKSYSDYPSAAVGEFGKINKVDYTEDIYVGYRYFSTFDPAYEKVNYEFGYGLSYTDFEIKNKTAQVKDGAVTVSATVKNTGEVAGKEVVQVYYSSPQSAEYNGENVYFGNPARELGGYVKTDLLEPGAEQTVSVSFPLSDMAVYDDTGAISLNSYLMLAGDYYFYAGNSVKNATLVSKYTQEQTAVGETLSQMEESLLPERLRADGSRETLYKQNIAAYGSTTIQGEAFDAKNMTVDSSSGDIFAKDIVGVKSFRYVGNLTRQGDFVEYEVFVEKAGTYLLGYSFARDSADTYANVGDIYVDGEKVASGLGYKGTRSWTAFRYFTGDTKLSLSEGKHTLRFLDTSGELPNIDLIMLYNNNVNPSGKTVIEAENYDGSTGGSGGGDLAATAVVQESGRTFSYTLKVEKAGKYDLTVFYSNLKRASAAGLEVSVGAKAQTVGLRRTARNDTLLDSNYYAFAESDSVIVDLPAGEVTLTLTAKDEALACLDKLVLTPYGNTPRVENAYFDNTAEFETVLSESGTTLGEPLSFEDLKEQPNKIDSFLSQFSVRELSILSMVAIPNKAAPYSFGIGSFGGLTLNALAGGNRFDLPQCWVADAGAGIRMSEYQGSDVVWFPCSTMLASTWNDALAEDFGKAIGRQFHMFDADMWLAPSVNIHRNPLCGRNFEYYSEDPLVSGKIGAAAVRGAQSTGISVCVKHFAANNQETTRFTSNSCVSNRALREIYLKPFEIIVKESQPLAIMSSYNMINGEYAGATESLLKDILRDEWGFDGAVLSDWICHVNHLELMFGGTNIKSIVHDDENAKETGGYKFISKAYLSGYVTRAELEENARDIVKLLLRLDGYKYPYGTDLYVDAAVRGENGEELSAALNFTKEEKGGVCKFGWQSEEYKIVSVSIDGGDKISLPEGSTEYTLRDISKETKVVFFAEKAEAPKPDVPVTPEQPSKGGCNGSVAYGSASIVFCMGIAIVCVLFVRKKKKQ